MQVLEALALKPPGGAGFGLLYLLILIVDIWLIVRVVQSRKTLLVKIVWIVLILLFSVLAWILYFFLGRERR